MWEDPATGTLIPLDLKDLNKYLPEILGLNVSYEGISLKTPIDSAELTPIVWTELVEIIETNYASFDGFVILHGTDTMAYTASALSFMIQGLNKPIILTGSQLPLGRLRTDGRENFITAIEIASTQKYLMRLTLLISETLPTLEHILFSMNNFCFVQRKH